MHGPPMPTALEPSVGNSQSGSARYMRDYIQPSARKLGITKKMSWHTFRHYSASPDYYRVVVFAALFQQHFLAPARK